MDIFETQVRLNFVVPAGEVDRIKGLVGSALGGLGGKIGGIGKLLGGAASTAALAAGAAGAIVMSSPSLQNTLEHLMKVVMLMIRPIGDIVSIGLRPLLDIMRPIGLFFRILIKPYLTKAMEAMKLGRGFMAKGEYGKAGEAYALGAAFLLKPFFDEMVTVSTIAVQGILWGIKMLGEGLLAVLDPLDIIRSSFSDTMDKAIIYVGEGGARIIVETSLMLETWLVTLKAQYKEIENTANVSMTTTSTFVGEGFVRIIEAATKFFVGPESFERLAGSTFDSILTYAYQKVAELNSLLDLGQTKVNAFGEETTWTSTVRTTTGGFKAGGGGGGGGGSSGAGGTYNFGGITITGNANLDKIVSEVGSIVGREVKMT